MFEVGDFVRSYDFEPSEGRKPQYIEGLIVDTDKLNGLYYIQVKKCTFGERVGEKVITPIEMLFDYEGRIQKVTP